MRYRVAARPLVRAVVPLFAIGALAAAWIVPMQPSSASVRPVGSAGTVGKSYITLTASDGAGGDQFGSAVAIAGKTAVVGAWKQNSGTGGAYIFVKSGKTWSQQIELTASDGADNDYFGSAVAISANGSIVVVGAFDHDSGTGAAYIFVKSGTTWSQQAELTASDGADNDGFGVSVGISGTTVVIGANGNNDYTGAAYVFVRSGTTWSQQRELTASDGADNDTFGFPVSISGSTVLVGAQGHDDYTGSAYIFVRSGKTWSQQTELTASDGADNDNFGVSVAVSGNTALLGSLGNNDDTGAAYVFVRSGATWSQQAELTASDGYDNATFGEDVALSGTTALVGNEPFVIDPTPAVYVFVQSGSTWSQTEELKPPKGQDPSGFGPIAISGKTALIGATGYNSGAGAAYVTK
jgi:hypothetical protein